MSVISPFREAVELEAVPAAGGAWSPATATAEPEAAEAEDAEEWEALELDLGEAQAEAAHPILSIFPLPGAVVEALSSGLSSTAVALAANAGYRNPTQLTNIVFYFRHPEMIGRKIQPEERDLAREWVAIRERLVRPALQSVAATAPAASPTRAAVSGATLSSDLLQWPEAPSPEALAFMRAVYDRHAARSKARGGTFVTDLPRDALAPIEGRWARKDAAEAARALLADARVALAAEGLADTIRIGIVSAYRPATRQFEIWQGRTLDGKPTKGGFPYYYGEAIASGIVRADDFSPAAADKVAAYLGGYIASPGYSNHQDGLAFDFGTAEAGKSLRALGWKSWFRKWLEQNAARQHFAPLATEAWHWTYHPPAGASEIWEGEVATRGIGAKRIAVARVPLLARHHGSGPDLVLGWNDMPSMPEELDVVVHLHGFWYPHLDLRRDVVPVSGLDLAPIEGATGHGRARPTLTVLPRGYDTGVKQTQGPYNAYTFPALVTRNGLTDLVRFALARFAADVGSSVPRVGRLILTAHSGGGKALLEILRYHDPHQVHVFDALYWAPDALVEWARRRIAKDRDALAAGGAAADYMPGRGGALRVFYQGRYRGGTRPNSLALRDALASELGADLAPWYRVEASGYDHFQIPRRYGWRVLADAAADVPEAYVEPVARREAELETVDFEHEPEREPEPWAEEDGDYFGAAELWEEADEGIESPELERADAEAFLSVSSVNGESPEWDVEYDVGGQPAKSKAHVAERPLNDTVDPFLDSRTSLFKVAVVGTNVHSFWPQSHDWTAGYTRRALNEAAVLAAVRTMYDERAPAAKMRSAWQHVVGHGIKYSEAHDVAVQLTVMDDAAMTKLAAELGYTPEQMTETWRKRRGEAKAIEFELGSAYKSFDHLAPHFSPQELAAKKLSVELVRLMLGKWTQSMIEVAKRHPAAKPWRDAFKRNPALVAAQREPTSGDFDKATWSWWAATILELAAATRTTVNEQLERERADARKRARNEYLRPHELKVDNVAAFILKTYDPTPQHLDQYGWSWVVQGGQTLHNAKNQQIYLLRAESSRVVYQNLVDKKLYEQTMDGFVQELVYGIYTAAGQASLKAIALSQWVIGLAGAIFPVVRYGLIATDVLNVAFKLKENREELERDYEGVKLAYANIDKLLPGVLPRIWDAVLDKRNVTLFNPLQHPDVGAWLKVVLRLVIERQARVAKASYVAEAVDGFLQHAWAAIKKGLGALFQVVKHVIIVGPAVVGSTGIRGNRALELAEQRLKEIGVVGAAAIVLQIRALSAADQQQLLRELQDLASNATKLMEVIKKSLSW